MRFLSTNIFPLLYSVGLFFLGSFLTMEISHGLSISNIPVGCAIALAAGFLPGMKSVSNTDIQALVYSGCFAGMCSKEIAPHALSLLIVSIFGALIYTYSKNHFHGYGGKLGTIAFLSVSANLLIMELS